MSRLSLFVSGFMAFNCSLQSIEANGPTEDVSPDARQVSLHAQQMLNRNHISNSEWKRFLDTFSKLQQMSIEIERIKAALAYENRVYPENYATDSGPRFALSALGLGLSVSGGAGRIVTRTHRRFFFRLGFGAGLNISQNFIGAILTWGTKQSFRSHNGFPLFDFSISVSRKSPIRYHYSSDVEWKLAHKLPTDAAFLQGSHSSRNVQSSKVLLKPLDSNGVGIGMGTMDEVRRFDFTFDLPFFIPRAFLRHLYVAEAKIQRSGDQLYQLNFTKAEIEAARAESELKQVSLALENTSKHVDQDRVSSPLPSTHRFSSIARFLGTIPSDASKWRHTCASLLSSMITGNP